MRIGLREFGTWAAPWQVSYAGGTPREPWTGERQGPEAGVQGPLLACGRKAGRSGAGAAGTLWRQAQSYPGAASATESARYR